MLVNGATGEDLENIIADNIAQMNELVVKTTKLTKIMLPCGLYLKNRCKKWQYTVSAPFMTWAAT